jgi:hypothetical protein
MYARRETVEVEPTAFVRRVRGDAISLVDRCDLYDRV